MAGPTPEDLTGAGSQHPESRPASEGQLPTGHPTDPEAGSGSATLVPEGQGARAAGPQTRSKTAAQGRATQTGHLGDQDGDPGDQPGQVDTAQGRPGADAANPAQGSGSLGPPSIQDPSGSGSVDQAGKEQFTARTAVADLVALLRGQILGQGSPSGSVNPGPIRVPSLVMPVKLEEEGINYEAWEAALKCQGRAVPDDRFIECLEKDMPETQANGVMMSLILSSTPKAWQNLLVSMGTARAALEWIRNKFFGEGAMEQNEIYRGELEKGTVRPGETIQGFIYRNQGYTIRLQRTGIPIQDRWAIRCTIQNLPAEFTREKEIWANMGMTSWEAAIQLILSAMVAKGIKPSAPFGLKGMGAAVPQQVGGVPAPGGAGYKSGRGQSGPAYSKQGPGERPRQQPGTPGYTGCNLCQGRDHKIRDCPHRDEVRKMLEKRQAGEQAGRDAGSVPARAGAVMEMAGPAGETGAAMPQLGIQWLHDSGSFQFLCGDIHAFKTLRYYEKPVDVQLATDESYAKCLGEGTICLVSNGRTQYLHGVQYVPGAANLLSVSKAVKEGLWFTHNNRGEPVCAHNPKTGFSCEIRRQGGMYVLEVATVDYSAGRCGAVPESKPTPGHSCERTKLLHERLGHPGKTVFREMACSGGVKGMYPTDVHCQECGKQVCEPCVLAKQTRVIFGTANEDVEVKGPLDILHMDTVGIIHPESHEGGKVMLTIVDGYSGMIVAVELNSKAEVAEELKKIMVGMEVQTGRVVRRIRSDNGTEFIKRDLTDWLRERGTAHDRSAPGNPQQNGVAERNNRTVVERVRTMLVGAGLSADYWGEALPTAVMLVNMSHRRGSPQSRYQMFTGRVPSVRHLKRFGCLAYVKVQKTGKFDPVSVAGMFIGYAPNRKAYRVAVGGKCVLISPSVVFDETRNGIDVLRSRDSIPAGLQLQPLGGLQALPGREEVIDLSNGEEYAVQWMPAGGDHALGPRVGTGVFVDVEGRFSETPRSPWLIDSGEVTPESSPEVKEREAKDADNFLLDRLQYKDMAVNLLDLEEVGEGPSPEEGGEDRPEEIVGRDQVPEDQAVDPTTQDGASSAGQAREVTGEGAKTADTDARRGGVKRGRTNKRCCRRPERNELQAKEMAELIRRMGRNPGEASQLAGKGVGQTPLEREPDHPAEAPLDTPATKRVRKVPDRFVPGAYACPGRKVVNGVKIPRSYKEAMESPEASFWKAACDEEMSSHNQHGTYEVTDCPAGVKPIPCKWVFDVKTDETGVIVRYKARLVAQGNWQVPGVDFGETFAPVCSAATRRVFFALGAEEDWEIHQVDVKTAFLNGTLGYYRVHETTPGVPFRGTGGGVQAG
jgi:hypothetical protein